MSLLFPLRKLISFYFEVPKNTVALIRITFKFNCPNILKIKVPGLVENLGNLRLNVVVTDLWVNANEVKH